MANGTFHAFTGTCKNGGTWALGSFCKCPACYTGPSCENLQCLNDGKLNSLRNRCKCRPSWAGTCCAEIDCGQYGTMVNETFCQCNHERFFGPYCRQYFCDNNGIPAPKAFYCHCPQFTIGRFCQDITCQNHAIKLGNHSCECTDVKTYGRFCEIIDCGRFGAMSNETYQCNCMIGFSGKYCTEMGSALAFVIATVTAILLIGLSHWLYRRLTNRVRTKNLLRMTEQATLTARAAKAGLFENRPLTEMSNGETPGHQEARKFSEIEIMDEDFRT